ncbi:large ribosomal subunit protein uL2-like [Miscanthus floridulus]|uniref:large ribosomal subunit protein uL2-like n=1 Tax=Miscanthus floridulus TaxID=154761 RepID=UPI00345A70E6
MYTGQFVYCGRRTTLSIGDVPPLHEILEGAVICNVEHGAGDSGTLVGVSKDYAIVISHNLDSGASARASRDYAISISRNPNNGIEAGGASHRRKAAMNDDKVDDARHPPVPLLLWQRWSLHSKGGSHHLIYVG